MLPMDCSHLPPKLTSSGRLARTNESHWLQKGMKTRAHSASHAEGTPPLHELAPLQHLMLPQRAHSLS